MSMKSDYGRDGYSLEHQRMLEPGPLKKTRAEYEALKRDAKLLNVVRYTIMCRDMYVSDGIVLLSIAEALGITLPARTPGIRSSV